MIKSTVKINEEIYRQMQTKALLPFTKVTSIVMSAVYAVCAIVLLALGEYTLGGLLVLLALALALLVPLAARKGAKTFAKRAQELYGAPEETLTAEFCDDAIAVSNLSSGAHVKIPYESIKRYSETKDLILLYTETRQMVSVFKADTDREALFAFLRTKPTKVKNWK